MNRIASQVSTSVENTAERARAPNHGGNPRVRIVGSTAFGSVMPGIVARATIPIRTGMNANSRSATAFKRVPVRTAAALAPPYAFWINPGEMMNAGPRSRRSVHPDPGPEEYVKSPNHDGSFGEENT